MTNKALKAYSTTSYLNNLIRVGTISKYVSIETRMNTHINSLRLPCTKRNKSQSTDDAY